MSVFTETPEAGKNEHISRRHTREILGADAPGSRGRHTLSVDTLLSPASARMKIGFVGAAAGTGATTLCFAAAEYLAALHAKRHSGVKPGGRRSCRVVTLLELDMRAENPAGKPYDKIGIDRRFAGRDFVSHYRLAAEGKPLQGHVNLDGGVGWVLRVPGEAVPVPDPTILHRLVNNVSGDVVLCDISAAGILNGPAHLQNRDALMALLADFDHIVSVFDPLPSSLLASVSAAEVCRAAAARGVPTTFVFNKLNAGVNLREATRFTGLRNYLSFPAVPAEAVYAAEYACRSLAHELTEPLSQLFHG